MAAELGRFVGFQIFGVIFAWAGAAAFGSALGVLSPTVRAIAASCFVTLAIACIGILMNGLTIEGVIQFMMTWFISGVIVSFLLRRTYLSRESKAKLVASAPYDPTPSPEPTFRRKREAVVDQSDRDPL